METVFTVMIVIGLIMVFLKGGAYHRDKYKNINNKESGNAND